MSAELVRAVVRLLLALPLVLAAAYLVLKYGLARRYPVIAGSRRLKLLEQLPLGPKTVLSLVSLGDKYYLFAHQDNSVSLVKELEELPEAEEIKIGDIVELTPRTIGEIDRLEEPERPARKRKLPWLAGVAGEKCSFCLKEAGRFAGRLKEAVTAGTKRVLSPGEKGEK
ncbi:MAG: flagellar biosynthetic protein FliO [Pelotomaculum sp.]|uniref:Flagellar protein n=1 Tax=Pelotomaculum thermopropionicum (strain DSM 13744 / JCM 10971 / SI) TaxID=370438 RepID=A5D0I3_PELTS|nr:flagellar biosynthetic protein FliO [Pelotomaculum sp.]BAF60258.1 flagellar biogenesis protein [Pelotomaculum thermopropionicum SI]